MDGFVRQAFWSDGFGRVRPHGCQVWQGLSCEASAHPQAKRRRVGELLGADNFNVSKNPKRMKLPSKSTP